MTALRYLALLILAGASGCSTAQPADVVFIGGTIRTMDPDVGSPEAVAVRDGRIVFVGSESGGQGLIGSETRVVDLQGRMLLPGFQDTHVHPVTGGIELGECDLNTAASRAEVVSMIGECAGKNPSSEWVRGGGYQLPHFPGGSPSRHLLDSLVRDRPAYLSSADGHSAWVNSRALELAGVDQTTADPPEGRIEREPNGLPAGTLRESAMGLVGRLLPAYQEEDFRRGLERALEMAGRFGITTWHEASADAGMLAAYAAERDAGTLTVRSCVSLRVDPKLGVAVADSFVVLRNRFAGGLVRPVAAKIFLDGVIEGQTAALLEDYTDRPGYLGELNVQPDSLAAIVGALDEAGFKVHLHAIGDRAIRTAFDAFEQQHDRDGGAGPRHIMAHIQLFDPADIPRFAELGVVASFQPLWAYEDTYITDLTVPRLGPARSRWLYPIRSVMETSAIVAAGSDWSVSSMDPLRAIEVAVTRRSPTAEAGVAWIPEEEVSLTEILYAYTMGGAMAGDMEDETGSITVGKYADLIVLDRDLYAIPPQEISDAKVLLTMLEGRVVYDAMTIAGDSVVSVNR